MKKIINDIIPFPGYKALTAWPLLFIRRKALPRFDEESERHENIHGEQQKELLCAGAVITAILAVAGAGWWALLALPLPIWLYILFYLVRLAWHRNHKAAYYNNPFEQEAYIFEGYISYLSFRKHFAWTRFIFETNFTKIN